MSLSTIIAPHVPYLRRYARALTGSQRAGDEKVADTLRALVADASKFEKSLPPRIALYRVFHSVLPKDAGGAAQERGLAGKAQERLQTLAPANRQALLLTTIEGFTTDEAARIMNATWRDVSKLVEQARDDIDRQTRARILIIEDETLIAMDLSDIVSKLGHSVVATADTASKAVVAAAQHKPDLVLADVQLADGSSGIDAVADILGQMQVPVIFITAFPDRLLTGERPEPTFLITKPYLEETVQAAVSQALFFESTREVA
ncbi:DNA-directed RNA polymerase specialized sigma subunit [alpha proteobacterium U9-1i]|nr:DNA-directed RNA polymerase specialized sigma subunit [alpha proteobacterium U9-1i]